MSTDDKNMTTQDLIKRLRSIMPLGPLTEEIHKTAADRLEELLKELVQERDESRAEVERLKRQLGERTEMVHADELSTQMLKLISDMNAANAPQIRPDPSRLEIAAMLISGWFANSEALSRNDQDAKWWLKQADALIAAAREAK